MMSSIDLDLGTQMMKVEGEWRHAYEASIAARADYQRLAASRTSSVELLDEAREHLDRAEALKGRIMGKIELLEDALLGQG